MSTFAKGVEDLKEKYFKESPKIFYFLLIIVVLAVIYWIVYIFSDSPKPAQPKRKPRPARPNIPAQPIIPIQQLNWNALKPANDPIHQKDVRYCYVGDDELSQQLNPSIYKVNSDTKVKCAHFEDPSEGSFEDDINFLWRQNTQTYYKPKNLNLPAVMRNGVMDPEQMPFTEEDTFLQKLSMKGEDLGVYNQLIRNNNPLPKKISKETLLV